MRGGEYVPAGDALLPRDAFGILLIGASGTGKSTSAEQLQRRGIVTITPTVATRGLRPVERRHPPCDHVFWSRAKFDSWEQAGGFIATDDYYGNPYGVLWPTKAPGGVVPLMVLKPKFVEPVLKQYPRMLTYQLEATEATVFKRMHGRGQDTGDIASRIREHAIETAVGRRLADCIFRNEGPLEQTLARLTEQIHTDQALYLATQALSETAPPQMDATMEAPYDATETFA